MAGEITITINGVKTRTASGKMVLEAANEANIYVPYLCYHPGLKPFAACRMCVVEVEGGRGYPASCTLPVQDGMVIRTHTPGVEDVRRQIMELLTAEHPHGCLTCHRVDLCGPQDICLRHVSVNDRCVTCPKNERCELKDTTRYVGVRLESPLDYKYRSLPIETGDPFYDRDYNLCIVCGRCVRVCEEVRGDNAITFTERAGRALVGTSYGTSLLESGCEFCGACLDVCPVGALVERDNKWEKASRVARTVCPHCPVGCQLNLEVNQFEKVIRVIPELNSPANRGQGCFKGKFGLDFVNHKERLRRPLIRRDGQLHEASWDEALELIAGRLPSYRGDLFALLTSPNSTNEEHYLAQKFARLVMGTNNVDQSSNIYPELVNPLAESLGIVAATNPTWDLENSRCILVFNANVTEEHNVLALPIKKAIKAGAKLLVIDPRQVELTRYASIWLRPMPGTELLLLGGLLKATMEGEMVQEDWVAEHCDSSNALLERLRTLDMDQVAQETGVPRSQIDEAARIFGTTPPAAVVYALDNVSRELRSDCVSALTSLTLLTGNLGVSGGGLFPLRQGANEQGGWDMGCVPHLLPGYRHVEGEAGRKELEQLWGSQLPSSLGQPLVEMFGAGTDGSVKAMMIIGDSPHFTDGELGEVLVAMESLEFLVVQDSFLGEAARRADVVLPRSTFAEKGGTYTNLERRVQLLTLAISVKNSEARPESWFLCQLAARMGASGFDFQDPDQVMEEIARVAPHYGGVSHARLISLARWVARPDPSNPAPTQVLYSDKEYPGIQWPCPTSEHPGTPVLYADGSDQHEKARLPVPQFRKGEQATSKDFPLLLVPGRVLLQSDRQIEIVKGRANQIKRDEMAELNSTDAAALGISNGDIIEIVTAQGRFAARASLSETTPPGVVAFTTLFGQLAVDLQASKDPDPMLFAPRLSVISARVEKVAG